MRAAVIILLAAIPLQARSETWPRHVIDDSSRGADGVRLADVNGDGLSDIVTGWEEGGLVRAYIRPGPARVKQPWPAVTVGRVASPEDAVFCDLDGDGATDVVSCCEGKTQAMFIHWAPTPEFRFRDSSAWLTQSIPCTQAQTAWMFAVPVELDGRPGPELLVGSKAPRGLVGWLTCNGQPRAAEAWGLRALCPAGWIMSLVPLDMDSDGDLDVLVSDRKGPRRGVYWLANPGPREIALPWQEHRLGADAEEPMFLDVGDLDRDGRRDVLVAVKPRRILWLAEPDDLESRWTTRAISFSERFGTAKAARIADVNGDGRRDLVVSCEQAAGEQSGVFWLQREGLSTDAWRAHDIAGPAGEKYDLVESLDLDSDGDLDVLTCEERDNLGVIWYENPQQMKAGKSTE